MSYYGITCYWCYWWPLDAWWCYHSIRILIPNGYLLAVYWDKSFQLSTPKQSVIVPKDGIQNLKPHEIWYILNSCNENCFLLKRFDFEAKKFSGKAENSRLATQLSEIVSIWKAPLSIDGNSIIWYSQDLEKTPLYWSLGLEYLDTCAAHCSRYWKNEGFLFC